MDPNTNITSDLLEMDENVEELPGSSALVIEEPIIPPLSFPTAGPSPRYKCNKCEKLFDTKEQLTNHHPDASVVCRTTEAANGSVDSPPSPKKSSSDKIYLCDMCPQTFERQGHLENHKRLHTGESTCDNCGEKFLRKRQMLFQPLRCWVCESTLERSGVPIKHEHNDTLVRSCECYQCKYVGITSNCLRRHNLIHGKVTICLACKICGYKCKSKKFLSKHELSHTSKTALKCDLNMRCTLTCMSGTELGARNVHANQV